MTSQGSYKIGSVTRITGFSAVLLRAWERRYGLLEPQRGPGGQRLYTDADLEVLKRVRVLLDAGRTIGEIATLGRGRLVNESEAVAAVSEDVLSPRALRSGRDALVEAALALDSARVNRALDDLAARFSPGTLIERVIQPVAREVGDLWLSGACSVASEHLVTAVFKHRILTLIESAESYVTGRARAVAACLPGEDHELGLLILTYFINRAGVGVTYLGNNLPLENCRQACEVTRPGALLLSVTRKTTFTRNRKALLLLLADIPDEIRVYLGGQGTPRSDAKLEAAGLCLVPVTESCDSATVMIATDLRTAGGQRRPAAKKRP